MYGHPRVGYKEIPVGSDRRNPIYIKKKYKRKKLVKEEAAEKLLEWCLILTVAFPWLAIKSYMGIFESTWWFYKNNIDLVPSFMANTAELYMNR